MGKLGSFLLGGAVGAGLALLFAPRTGEETRALIADKADEYWGKGQTWYDQGRDYVRESVAGVQPTISKKSDELRQKIDNARSLIAEQVAKNASAARDVINDKVPVAAERINQAADVVRGHIDNATDRFKHKAPDAAEEAGAESAVQGEAEPETQAAPVADKAAEAAAAVEAPAAAVPLEFPDKVEPQTSDSAAGVDQ